MLAVLPASTRDALLLVARLVLGVVLVAHGWQKLVTNGLAATGQAFAGMGVPAPSISATFAAIVELVGGAMIIAGAATAVACVLVVLDMLGAATIVHIPKGVFASSGGWELVGVIAGGALLLAAVGAGRFSVDHVVRARRATTTSA